MVFIHFEYLYHSTDLTKDQNDLFKSSHLCANKKEPIFRSFEYVVCTERLSNKKQHEYFLSSKKTMYIILIFYGQISFLISHIFNLFL